MRKSSSVDVENAEKFFCGCRMFKKKTVHFYSTHNDIKGNLEVPTNSSHNIKGEKII